MWKIGQKIVCLDDRFHRTIYEWGDQIPKLGHVYTIKKIFLAPHWHTREYGLAFSLAELKNPGDRLCFSAWRFGVMRFDDPTASKRMALGEAEGAYAAEAGVWEWYLGSDENR